MHLSVPAHKSQIKNIKFSNGLSASWKEGIEETQWLISQRKILRISLKDIQFELEF